MDAAMLITYLTEPKITLAFLLALSVITGALIETLKWRLIHWVDRQAWRARMIPLQRKLMQNFGYSEAQTEEEATVVDAYCFVVAICGHHLLMSALLLPVVLWGWDSCGPRGHLMFYAGALGDLAYSIYDSLQIALRTFCPEKFKCLGVQMPLKFFIIMVCMHHMLSIFLTVPMILFYPSLRALHVIMDSEGEGMDMMKAKSLNPSRGRQAMRRSSIQQPKPPASPSPSSSLSGRRSSLSVSNKKRATLSGVEKKRFTASPSPETSKTTTSSPVSSASLKRRGSLQASFGTAQARSGLMLPWEIISMRLREGAKNEPCSAFLRAPALMELLCKVAFSYLGCYGNMQQRSMSTLMQSVWLLVYMRFTAESVRGSLERRSSLEGQAGQDGYGALGRAARLLCPEVWKIKAAPDFQEVPLACVKPVPREVLRQTTRQASEAPQEGVPYVMEKRCQICKSEVEVASWGNIRCFGCSRVDSLAFRRHPLVSVLRKSGEKPVALAGKVPRVRNTSLSPVRFQDNDTLRPDTELPGDEDFEVAGLSRGSSLRDGSFAPSSQS